MTAFQASNSSGQKSSYADYEDWYKQYVADLIGQGQALTQVEPEMYQGPRIADFTPDQMDAFDLQRSSVGEWRNYLDPALNLMNESRGGLDQARDMYTQGAIYDDPTYENTFWANYEPTSQRMVDEARRIGDENFTNTTLAGLNQNFKGSGGWGGGRHQILGADAAAMAEADILGKQAGIEMQGRQGAMADYLNWAKQQQSGATGVGNVATNQSGLGTNLWNLGTQAQGAQSADAATLYGIGAQQQAMDQSNLNLAYQDFQTQQQLPWQNLSQWSALTRGQTIPHFDTSSGTDSRSEFQTSYGTAPTEAMYNNPWTSAVTGGLMQANAMGAFK